MDQQSDKLSRKPPRGMLASAGVAVLVCAATYGLLPDSLRVFSRLAIAVQAGSVCILAAALTPGGAGYLTHAQRRGVPALLAAMAVFLVGRITEVLSPRELEWPGMWYFLGLIILLWAMLRPERPA